MAAGVLHDGCPCSADISPEVLVGAAGLCICSQFCLSFITDGADASFSLGSDIDPSVLQLLDLCLLEAYLSVACSEHVVPAPAHCFLFIRPLRLCIC